MNLTKTEYAYLRWAIGQAEMWRGSLVGNPDTTALVQFDKHIRTCKHALKKVSPYKKGGATPT